MAAYTKINSENMFDYPFGTRIRFDYGAGCGEEFGVVTDYSVTRWGAALIVETEAGERKQVSGISTVGIGAYVVGFKELVGA